MIILLMGVSGSGKSTVGQRLSEILSWPFYDGDDYHSTMNKNKMIRGEPLTDADRLPWLNALVDLIKRAKGGHAVLACSALKKTYRKILNIHPDVLFVHLNVSFAVAEERLMKRKGHFFNVTLLKNQFETFEDLTTDECLNFALVNCDNKTNEDVIKLVLSAAQLNTFVQQ